MPVQQFPRARGGGVYMGRGLLLFALALIGVSLFAGLPATSKHADAAATDKVRVLIDLQGRPQSSDTAIVSALGGNTRHVLSTSNTIAIEIPSAALPIL